MSRLHRWLSVGTLLVLPLSMVGCSRAPSRIPTPPFNASAAGSAALAAYDKNGDGALDATELVAAPQLLKGLSRYDANGDSKIDASEIAARVDRWTASRIGLSSVHVVVTMDGGPLEGATVTFEPEEFLGGVIEPASGVSDVSGNVSMTIAEDKRSDPRTTGVQPGWYKVRISKQVGGQEVIPAIYNTQTTLGAEVAIDAPEAAQAGYQFPLSSKKPAGK